jgi:hypothetical protein
VWHYRPRAFFLLEVDMRSIVAWSFIGAALIVVACGDDGGEGGAGGQGTGAQTSSATNAATGSGGGGQGGGSSQSGGGMGQGGEGGGDCGPLLAAVETTLAAAKVCNPLLGVQQCTTIAKGVCCQVALNPANAQAVADYEAAYGAFTEAGCVALCPPVPCPDETVGVCTGMADPGTCVEQPG